MFYLLSEAPATTAQSKMMACSPMAIEITSSAQKLTKPHQFSSQRHLWASQQKKISFTKQELTLSTPLVQPEEGLWQGSLQRGGCVCVVRGEIDTNIYPVSNSISAFLQKTEREANLLEIPQNCKEKILSIQHYNIANAQNNPRSKFKIKK